MEFFVVVLILAVLAVPLMSVIALIMAGRVRHRLDRLDLDLNDLRRRVYGLERGAERAIPGKATEPALQTPTPSEEPPLVAKSPTPPAIPSVPMPSTAPSEPTTVDSPKPTAAQPEPALPEIPLGSPKPASSPSTMAPPTSPASSGFSGLERALGLRWTVWVGGLIIFVGAGFFVKYAFEQSWLGPLPRVITSLVSGLGVLLVGERFIRKQMRALGQGLVGVGLAILYAALYGAYGYYEILPQGVTFSAMVLVTAIGLGLALWHNALPVSFLATMGGFLTPLMLSSGADARNSLFAYLLVLDLGVLAVALFKKWRALDVLAFLCTSAMFAGWYSEYGRAYQTVAGTVLWLAAFYLVFLLVPFVYHLRTATCITGERFFLAVSNAIGMFGWAYALLRSDYQHTLGGITLGMGLAYMALGLMTRYRIPADQKAVFGFASLFLAFVTIAVPIHLDLHAVTIAWAVKAPLLLFLAYKYRYLPVRIGSLIPLIMSIGRLFVFHWPLHGAEPKAFSLILNSDFGTCLIVLLAGYIYNLIHAWHREVGTATDDQSGRLVGLMTGLLTVFFCHMELWQWLTARAFLTPRYWSCAFVWIVSAGVFAGVSRMRRSSSIFLTGFVPLAVGLFLVGCAYQNEPASLRPFISGRFLAGLSASAIVFALAWASHVWTDVRLSQRRQVTHFLLGMGVTGLTILCMVDLGLWLDLHKQQILARHLFVFMVAGAAWALYGFGVQRPSYGLRLYSMVAALLAALLSIYNYAFRIEANSGIVFNLRFLGALLPVLLALWYAWALRRETSWYHTQEKTLRTGLYCAVSLFVFGLLNLETYYHVSSWVTDPQRARWIAQMALSLVWGGYATVLLVLGFRFRLSWVRLTALTLYGVTALKLVLVDMAQVQELFRIVSFVGLGVLMIGASYLYHRAVQRLE